MSPIFPDESALASVEDVATLGERAKRRLWARLTRECEAMAQHALSTGHTVPIEGPEPRVATHQPSPQPRQPPRATVASLGCRRRKRVIEQLAVVSLIVLLGVSLSPDINSSNMSKTLLELSGAPLFLVEIFLISASSLGSCFACLHRINRYVSEGTWNPKYRSTYWTRWVMGVISGIVLSQLVYDLFVTSTSAPKAGATIPSLIGGPLLALLGGYSVDVVHSILNRIINAVSSVFRGPDDDSSGRQRSLADAGSINT
jgi:hypothetical protein